MYINNLLSFLTKSSNKKYTLKTIDAVDLLEKDNNFNKFLV